MSYISDDIGFGGGTGIPGTNNSAVPSGIYSYRMDTSNSSDYGKITFEDDAKDLTFADILKEDLFKYIIQKCKYYKGIIFDHEVTYGGKTYTTRVKDKEGNDLWDYGGDNWNGTEFPNHAPTCHLIRSFTFDIENICIPVKEIELVNIPFSTTSSGGFGGTSNSKTYNVTTNNPIALNYSITPSNTTHQIVSKWEIVNSSGGSGIGFGGIGGTNMANPVGAKIENGILTTERSGQFTLRATIVNGKCSDNYTQDFVFNSCLRVDSIDRVPLEISPGMGQINLPTSSDILPKGASNTTIEWSVIGTLPQGITMSADQKSIEVKNAQIGQGFTLRALIKNGECDRDFDRTYNIQVVDFIRVKEIKLDPNYFPVKSGNANIPLDQWIYLLETSTSIWQINLNDYYTVISMNGNVLDRKVKWEASNKIDEDGNISLLTPDKFTITATIERGLSPAQNYVQKFNVEIVNCTPVEDILEKGDDKLPLDKSILIATGSSMKLVREPLQTEDESIRGILEPDDSTYNKVNWIKISGVGTVTENIKDNYWRIYSSENGNMVVRPQVIRGACGGKNWPLDTSKDITVNFSSSYYKKPESITASGNVNYLRFGSRADGGWHISFSAQDISIEGGIGSAKIAVMTRLASANGYNLNPSAIFYPKMTNDKGGGSISSIILPDNELVLDAIIEEQGDQAPFLSVADCRTLLVCCIVPSGQPITQDNIVELESWRVVTTTWS